MIKKYNRIDWTKLKPQPVIGVDEAGRGCLAGPVFSSAVLFGQGSALEAGQGSAFKASPSYKVDMKQANQAQNPNWESNKISPNHYPDSKQIPPEERKKLATIIKNQHIYAVGLCSVKEIENLNILQASLLSMKRAVMACYSKAVSQIFPPATPVHVLVDGNFLIPNLPSHFHQTAFIKGDQRLSPIASASIIAKVDRDKWISQQDSKYPQYGFAKHKGYGTVQHRKALAQYGPCPLHRKTFNLNLTG